MKLDPTDPRTRRKRRLQQRQTVIFGSLLAGLAVSGLLSIAVASGTIGGPFQREFTGSEEKHGSGIVPCAPPDAVGVPYPELDVRIFNGSELSGLARLLGENFTERGIKNNTGDFDGEYSGSVLITSGIEGVPHAYTLARLFKDPVINVDARPGTIVDLVLGKNITSMVEQSAVEAIPADAKLKSLPNCKPAEKLAAATLPPAPPHTTPTAEAPAEQPSPEKPVE